VRASATSRIASSAPVHAAQAKDNAGKADEASPFALLLESTAHTAKPSHKDTRDSDDHHGDDKTAGKQDAKRSGHTHQSDHQDNKTDAVQADGKTAAKRDAKRGDDRRDQQDAQQDKAAAVRTDSKAAAKQDARQSDDAQQDDKADAIQAAQPISTAVTGKADKSDKEEDKKTAKADSDATDASQAAELVSADLQILPPAPQPAPPATIAVTPDHDDAGSVQADTASPANNDARDTQNDAAAATAQASADAAIAQASAATTAAQASATTGATQATAAAAAVQPPAIPATTQIPAVSATAQASTSPAPAPASAAPSQTPAASAQASDTSQADDGEDFDAQALTSTQALAQAKTDAKPAVPATKTDAAKPVKTAANAKPPSPDHAGTADAPKSDAVKTDADKTGDVKSALPQAASANETAKPGPQLVQAVNTTGTGIAAPQALQPASAPTITQHVQVTEQPVPNIPALAVTIAAKSQSGARQFDIRLDPPELGRVDVRLSIDATGKASAHLSADHPQTLDLLQKDSSSLTRALRDAGLNVSQDGLNFSLRQQASGHDGGNAGGHGGRPRTFSAAAIISTEATVTSAAYRSVADGRLDIRV